jgi:transcriptional regulator with XRE-family HTH domain
MKRTLNSNESKILGDWLRSKRKEKGLTMRALAIKINSSHTFVAKVENQERRLDVLEFISYSQSLGLDPTESFKEITELVSNNG